MRIQTVVIAVVALAVSSITLTPSARAEGSTKTVKDWTFLVYLNGNNSLDSFGTMNLLQMEKIGSTDKVNIVVQWASLSAQKTTRLLIQKSSDGSKVTSPVVQDLGNADMGDYRTLIDFIKWGAEKYPAKHYFVDVWDHGNGWHGTKALGAPGKIKPMDVSWDDNTGHFFTTNQLGEALAEGARTIGHKIDLFSSDACLMAMAEVADQVASSVDFYAGSEDLEPGPGWPYDALLAKWNALPSASAADVAKILTTEYTNSYKGGENGNSEVTFSAYDLSKRDAFNASIAALGKQMSTLDTGNRKKLMDSTSGTQTFTLADYADVIDFLDHIQTSGVRGIEASTIQNVRTAVKNFVIANEVTPQFAKAHGISFWFPPTLDTYKRYSDYYNTLSFEGATGWGNSLRYVLQDTR